jgi:DNA-binding MarR family transcriptional regulator
MTKPADPTHTLRRRLRDGLERVAAALRADEWSALESAPLNPTQAQILGFLCGRDGARVGVIARHLGVSQPTATDSLAALERKGLTARRADPRDARAVEVVPTAAGAALVADLDAQETTTDRALATLTEPEQRDFLAMLIKIIRALQTEGAIPPQRLCVTCRYFRPNAHSGPSAPHHCDYVDAAFGAEALRLDCPEQVEAEPEQRDRAWRAYLEDRAAPHDIGSAPS